MNVRDNHMSAEGSGSGDATEVLSPKPGKPQEHVFERLVRLVAGTLLAHPWFDAVGLYALRRWFFPVSRLWAAARSVNGNPDRFCDAVPMYGPIVNHGRLRRALSKFERARADVARAESEWERAFFGSEVSTASERAEVEEERLTRRHAYNATRRHFRYLNSPDVPRVKLDIATPEQTAALYDDALVDLSAFTCPPEPAAKVEVSRKFHTATGQDYWLRFQSPSERLDDMVYARVHEPEDVHDPPTIIFGHGVCVEFDHWRGLIDECHHLVRLGFRVIRPEAPWHGRRVPPGNFGGERVVATFPTGVLDTLLGGVREWAVLARWAREMSSGPLAFGGSSLGALTSQLAADRAADWPEVLRPDALLLITHCEDLSEAVLSGALAGVWMDPQAVQRTGWTEELARKYLSLLGPKRRLTVPPQRIVSVLGRRDVILPFASGQRLVERWCVPEANLFIWDRGHFSVPMTLVRNDAPLRRFANIMQEML